MNPFISICILSYNRPETLSRLLETIDATDVAGIEILVCEDRSPRMLEVRDAVAAYCRSSSYQVKYFENDANLGYDGNFNQLLSKASGAWLVFMGDDDEFVPGALDKMKGFLMAHSHLGYVMKSHCQVHEDGQREYFRYFPETRFFEPGVSAYVKLFRRSVFISGFTIRRDLALPFKTDRFDGTMLMQLYLLAEVVLKAPSAYFDEPFTLQYASHAHNDKDVMFDREANKFVPRRPTIEISLKFLSSFSKITDYIDGSHGLSVSKTIKHDMSKYFYPSLALYRDSGLRVFFRYVLALNRLGFNVSIYYKLYVVLLVLLGRRICDWGIRTIKRNLGYTPQL